MKSVEPRWFVLVEIALAALSVLFLITSILFMLGLNKMIDERGECVQRETVSGLLGEASYCMRWER